MNIVFWAHSPTQQIVPFLSSLAAVEGFKVSMVVDYLLSDARSQIGWDVPSIPGNIDVVLAPAKNRIFELVDNSPSGTYHIFPGFNNSRTMATGFHLAIKNENIRVGIFAEPYNWIGFYGTLRFLRSLYRGIRYNRKIDLFLAVGNKGLEVYRKSGFSLSKLFVFSYVALPVDIEASAARLTDSDNYKILFSGSLIKRKGVDILLKALCCIKGCNIEVNIVGDGDKKSRLIRFAKENHLDFVNFYPFKRYHDLIEFMGEHDLFILPSRRDGWGGVVNESLFRGTPVIASDHCGVSLILNAENKSDVFHSGDYEQLATLIQRRIDKGKVNAEERLRISQWASRIAPNSMAEYFSRIISYIEGGGDRPSPPW